MGLVELTLLNEASAFAQAQAHTLAKNIFSTLPVHLNMLVKFLFQRIFPHKQTDVTRIHTFVSFTDKYGQQ